MVASWKIKRKAMSAPGCRSRQQLVQMKIIPVFRRTAAAIDKKHSPPGADVDVTMALLFIVWLPPTR
jgi:hypothetical protein